jgi:hypothetical protein
MSSSITSIFASQKRIGDIIQYTTEIAFDLYALPLDILEQRRDELNENILWKRIENGVREYRLKNACEPTRLRISPTDWQIICMSTQNEKRFSEIIVGAISVQVDPVQKDGTPVLE